MNFSKLYINKTQENSLTWSIYHIYQLSVNFDNKISFKNTSD